MTVGRAARTVTAPSCEEVEVKKSLLFPLCLLLAATALAQGALPIEFPSTSKAMSAPALRDALSGKAVNVDLADDTRWRLEYKANGYFFVNTSTGFSGTGDWRADEERLCTRLRGGEMSCNEVRDAAGTLYLRPNSGEVIALTQR